MVHLKHIVMVRVTNQGHTMYHSMHYYITYIILIIGRWCCLCKLLPNLRSQFHSVYLSIRTLQFTILYIYILKISIYGMRDNNRPGIKLHSKKCCVHWTLKCPYCDEIVSRGHYCFYIVDHGLSVFHSSFWKEVKRYKLKLDFVDVRCSYTAA